tara:strand:- start:116 stop:460 length:345 start_codon:yes stop_codon:yes gene_type:complete
MSFFQSDVVRAEMAEIQELQEEVYNNVFKFPSLPKSDQKYHVEILERLLEKQKVMYARLSLSDDPEAKEMKKQITDSAAMMGLPQGADINSIFNDMSRAVSFMKQQVDTDQLGL